MGIGRRVDDDEIDLVAAGLLDVLDQFGFGVALAGAQPDAGFFGQFSEPGFYALQGFGAVLLRLTAAQQIQIRAVDEQDVFGGCHVAIAALTPVCFMGYCGRAVFWY